MTNRSGLTTGLVPVAEIEGETAAETAELDALWRNAEKFVSGFAWCGGVVDAYLAVGVPAVIGVFLLRIVPARPEVDEWIWVVVGDLPPAYLSTDHCRNASEAIRGYLAEMNRWVEAIQQGQPVDDLIPVNAPPTPANVAALKTRLTLLEQDVMSALNLGELTPRRRKA